MSKFLFSVNNFSKIALNMLFHFQRLPFAAYKCQRSFSCIHGNRESTSPFNSVSSLHRWEHFLWEPEV